jgi:protein-tyrosine phosphatase
MQKKIDLKTTLIEVDGVTNIRNIGGIPVKNNRVIKKRCILRSGSLHEITDKGIAKLKNDFHLSHVYDLRSKLETEDVPDIKIDGVKYTYLEVLKADTTTQNVPLKSDEIIVPENSDIMFQNYIDYAVGEDAIKSYKNFFNDLINEDDTCILFHCRSGKDRTGILALLIEYILQVDIKNIHEDYLLVNETNKAGIDWYVKQGEKITQDPYRLHLMRMGGGTSLELLDNFYKAIQEKYGNLENYILKALDIDYQKRKILIDKYTEERCIKR